MDLDQLDDKALVLLVKDNGKEASKALQILEAKHSGVFKQIVNNYMPASFSETDKRITFEEKPTFFFDAVRTFKEDKDVEFITWLVNKTRYELLSKRSKEKKSPKFCELNLNSESEDHTYEENFYGFKKDEIEKIFELLNDKFGQTMTDIFKDRYFGNGGSGESFFQIGQKFHYSHQTIKSKHEKMLKFLKSKLTISK